MTLEQLQQFIIDFKLTLNENGDIYILPLETGYQTYPIEKIEDCITITQDQMLKIMNGELVFNPKTKSCEVAPKSFKKEKARIEELKKLLSETDYKAIKYLEGYITFAEYEPIKALRQSYRDEINALQEVIKNG